MSLTLEDFRRVVVYPRGIAIGLAEPCASSPPCSPSRSPSRSRWTPCWRSAWSCWRRLPQRHDGQPADPPRGDTALSISMTGISSARLGRHRPALPDRGESTTSAPTASRTSRCWPSSPRSPADHGVPLALGMWLAGARRRSAWTIVGPVPAGAFGVFAVVVGVIVAGRQGLREPRDAVAAAGDRSQRGGDVALLGSPGSPGSTTASRPRSR